MADFVLPHLDISGRSALVEYKSHKPGFGPRAPIDRATHGARLSTQLNSVLSEVDASRADHSEIYETTGSFLEVDISRGVRPQDLERKSQNIYPGAIKESNEENTKVVLYVPDDARAWFCATLEDYTSGPLTLTGNPRKKAFVESIDQIRQANLESLWADELESLPYNSDNAIWWELWCRSGTELAVSALAHKLGGLLAEHDYWLEFPEANVVPVYATRPIIELLFFGPPGLLELRRASASPIFFTEELGQDQLAWATELAERVTWPSNNVPVVCLLDTGINRGHVLIEPALTAVDSLTHNQEWGVDDHNGHGTKMAGIALHGDLTPRLTDHSTYTLSHRMESVKILPPSGFPRNAPASLGSITQSAVSRSEINSPLRQRVFCMAISNRDVSGTRPSAWSAAIDQIAAGAMPGEGESTAKRLFIQSSGNIPSHIERDQILPAECYPCEDPSQAWNALAVGGYTAKTDILEEDLHDWSPFAAAGDLSPYSRTSERWTSGKSPYKPDIVMEAGNRAVSPAGNDVLEIDSLSLLTTGNNVDRNPLVSFAATSAAAAQAARFAARLCAAFPSYWPETIRALIIHSAEWTPAMHEKIEAESGLRSRYKLLRQFGYGVPNFDRAMASAKNNLAMITEKTIQPFTRGRKFNHCHYYRLPWPREILQALGEEMVSLKITLSYFIEPNPGFTGSTNPTRYQSFGLRFDLRRPLESEPRFKSRVNANEDIDETESTVADTGWTFGADSMSAGSLHSDTWSGTAAQLASRDMLCIKPIMGWWRDRASLDICQRQARYALIITISTEEESIDLHTQINNIITADVEIDTSVIANR